MALSFGTFTTTTTTSVRLSITSTSISSSCSSSQLRPLLLQGRQQQLLPNFISNNKKSRSPNNSVGVGGLRQKLSVVRSTRTGKQQQSSGSESAESNKRKKKKKKQQHPTSDEDEEELQTSKQKQQHRAAAVGPPPLPKPPAGFVLDDQGRVLLLSNKRVATIVDSTNNSPLECIIRRVFPSSRGHQCMLLCPLDMPVQILKSTNVEGWSAVSDDEVEAILPNAAYALAKLHIHLVNSGFCYTARGGFCYTEDDIFEFRTDDGQDVDGLPTEGIEITCFHLDGSHYMVYTPSDPLLFVVVKDQNGELQIVDDDLLEDPAVIGAVDEETEFNALVEEEAALLESLLGKR